ncbi:MAG: MFS transporter, partial [Sulfitobacter sp.]
MAILQDIKVSYKPLGGFIAIGLAWSAFFAQMPVVKAGTGASDGAFGLAMLWASVGAVAAMWMAPWAYQRAGRFAVPLSICVIAAGLVGAGMVGTLWALAIMLFLISIGTGVVDVLINAQVAEIEARTGRKLMSLNHSLYSFAYAAAAFGVGGFRTAGWTPVQIFWVCFVILGVLAFTTIGRRVAVSAQSEGPTPNAGLPIALVLAAGALVFFAFLTESSTEGWSALYIERELHGSAQQGAMGPAMLGLMMGIGRLSGHVLTRAMSEIRLMVLGAL